MLTKSTEYAIRALIYIQLRNLENKRPGVEEIAREIEAPKAYSGKILQILTKHNLLKSLKGRGGGFFFDDNESKLTVFEVIQVMEGDGCFVKCGIGLKDCSDDNPCPMHSQYISVRDTFSNIVQTETIQSLAEKIENGIAFLNRIENNK